MANDFYNASGNPAPGAPGSSQVMRTEFASIQGGFDKMPALTGNAGKRVIVNDAGNALTVGSSSELKVATSDQSIASETEFTEDEGLVGFALAADATYRVDGMLLFETASETPDVKLMFVAPVQPTAHAVKILFDDANGDGTPDTVMTLEGISSERLGLATDRINVMLLKGFIWGGVSDTTWSMQWAPFVSSATPVIRKAGSYIELTRMT